MRGVSVLAGTMLIAISVSAQGPEGRAWQQRLQLDIQLPVPAVELESVNPFALPVDAPPRLLTSAVPSKVAVVGPLVVAAYVDARGDCLGAVPLELPFPGLTSVIIDELSGSRFDPAMDGTTAAPSWVVVEVSLQGKVKEGEVAEPVLDLPDPTRPPDTSPPPRVSPSGNLNRLPAVPAADLTSLAVPKRFKIKAPGQAADVLLTALVHITSDGRCDRFVPLDMPSGLGPWLSAYLASWRLEPAMAEEAPAEAWLIYTGRVRLQLSSLQSGEARTLADRVYDPHEDTDTGE